MISDGNILEVGGQRPPASMLSTEIQGLLPFLLIKRLLRASPGYNLPTIMLCYQNHSRQPYCLGWG